MDEAVESWVKTSRDDWAVAETLFGAGRWSHAVFMCHECLEKLLNALYVQKKSSLPLTTHNLSQLCTTSRHTMPSHGILKLPAEHHPRTIIRRRPNG